MLPSSQPSSQAARKTVTILFADISGFTPLGERLDVESLRLVMGRYFSRMREAVERHEGMVAKFIGDAVMAAFGMTTLHEDDALRAVRAALEMREALAALNPELQRDHGVTLAVRIGVNTGEVVVSDAPSASDLVVGDAVNLAARLEQAAQPGEIVLGRATHRLVRDAVVVEPMEPQLVKGKSKPVDALRLITVKPGAAPIARRLDALMVGRLRELDTLRQTFGRAVSDGACHLVTLLGSAGVGKSRLVEELIRAVGGEARILRGHCVSYGEGTTYLPVRELLRGAALITDDESTDDALSKLRSVIEGLSDSELILHDLASLLGLAGWPSAPEQTQWAVRKLIESMANQQPLIIVFDDVHWGESTFLDLVEHIAEWSRGVPILLVCTARQELLDIRPTWGGGKLNATTMLLEPLTREESAHLLSDLIGNQELTAPVRERIVESAEGNPLFLEEMLAMVIEDQVPLRDNGRRLAEVVIVAAPPTIRALLAARLERLTRAERQVIERAAVVGRVFDRQAILHLCPDVITNQVPVLLRALVRADLIRPDDASRRGDEVFRFRHALIRDAAYESIAKQVRSDLHERFAAWLQATPERAVEAGEVAGYHLEQAYRYRIELGPADERARAAGQRGAALLADAGRRAASRGDMPSAVGLLSRATGLLADDGRGRVALLPELGAALLEAGDFGRADSVLAEAVEGAGRLNDRRLATYARLERERLRMTVDPEASSERARDVAEEAIAIFARDGGDRGLALAWQLEAEVYLLRGQLSQQLDALQHALTHAQRLGERRLEAAIQIALTGSRFFGPTPVGDCREHCQRTLAWARANGSRLLEAIELDGLGLLDAMVGRFQQARDLVSQGRAILEDLGMRVQLGTVSLVAGAVEVLAGDPAAAERELKHGFDLLRQAGEKAVLSTVVAELADAVYAQARYLDVLELTQIAEAAAASDDAFSQVLWRTIRAKVQARQEHHQNALSLARDGLAIAERTEYLELRARAQVDLGEVLGLAGLRPEAAAARASATHLYEQKGNLVMRDRLLSLGQQR